MSKRQALGHAVNVVGTIALWIGAFRVYEPLPLSACILVGGAGLMFVAAWLIFDEKRKEEA